VIKQARSTAEFERVHLQAMHIGSEVTGWFRKEREPNVLAVTPENVIAALHRAGISFVLMGVHGINGYRDEARATGDVDVLVPQYRVRKAIRVIDEAFPYLEIRENSAVARFINPVTQKVVIDVMKPASEAMRLVFRNSVWIGKTHRIPDLEMAIVSKYLAMTGQNRKPDKKHLDAGDFSNIILHNRQSIDVVKLKRLGDRVRPGGGAEIMGYIAELDAGRAIKIK
jgi:hypothetical protein